MKHVLSRDFFLVAFRIYIIALRAINDFGVSSTSRRIANLSGKRCI